MGLSDLLNNYISELSTGDGRSKVDEDGIHFRAKGGRVHLAEGSEDIVEPSKSMQVDTTTKGLRSFYN